jgi:hypothetical protein
MHIVEGKGQIFGAFHDLTPDQQGIIIDEK